MVWIKVISFHSTWTMMFSRLELVQGKPGWSRIYSPEMWTDAQAHRQLSDRGGGFDQYPFFNYLTKYRNVQQTQHDWSVRKGGSTEHPESPLAMGLMPRIRQSPCTPHYHNAPAGKGGPLPSTISLLQLQCPTCSETNGMLWIGSVP